MKIVIGARKSMLAKLQAYQVARHIQALDSSIEIEFKFRASQGDVNAETPLHQSESKGLFTEDLQKALLNDEMHIAVHSWKDLPTETRPGTEVVCTLKREDPRDVVFLKYSVIEDFPESLEILTGSPRRWYNLEDFLKWALPIQPKEINFSPVRGNIETRILKLLHSNADGVVVAKAALDRILRENDDEFGEARVRLRQLISDLLFVVVPLSINPSAAGQGALALEVRSSNESIKSLLQRINHEPTFLAADAERKVLASYGGGCHQKIGVTCFERPYGSLQFLKGETTEGQVLNSKVLNRESCLPKVSSESKIWSCELAGISPFSRKQILDPRFWGKESDAYWVSKADAIPKNFPISISNVIWVAGLATWKKMAQRGFFVNGCADSLGEYESPKLKMLKPHISRWVKLTHQEGYPTEQMQILATYKLEEAMSCPNLSEFTHFWWKSSSQFKWALKYNPDLIDKVHGCGVGVSHEEIANLVSEKGLVAPFLDYQDFFKEVT